MPGLDDAQLFLVETLDEAWEFKRWLGERHEGDILGLDIETTGRDPRDAGAGIRLIQFGDTQQGWAIPWENWRGLALEALSAWDKQFVIHNIAFEYKWLSIHSPFVLPRDRCVDTMLAAHVIDPVGSGSLKQLANKHVDKRASAGDIRLKEAFDENGWNWATVPIEFEPFWTYSALDPIITARLWLTQQEELAASRNVFDLEMAARFIVSRMEMTGTRVDLEYSRTQHDRLTEYAENVKEWGRTTYGVNLGSNVQLARVLLGLGGEALDYTPTGQPKMDKHALEIMSDPDNGYSAEVQMLSATVLKMRKSQKWASAYFANFLSRADENSVIHPEFRTLGARTSRMSVANPALQQLPARGSALVRKAFIPRDGNRLITCDSDQVEARIFAVLSDDKDLKKAFYDADDTGSDFFTQMGVQVYADPSFQKTDKRRNLLKGLFYGRLYGAGVPKMAETAGVTIDRMQSVADAMNAQFPGIQKFIESTEADGMRKKVETGKAYVITPSGRRMPADDKKEYTLVNYLVQSTAAEKLKEALVRLDAAGYENSMILAVHDEILFDVPETDVEQAMHEIPSLMADMEYPVPLSAGIDGPYSESWGEKYE